MTIDPEGEGISAPASNSRSWQRFVAGAEESSAHDELVRAFLDLRSRCVPVADQISKEMPQYTLHNVENHSDYLWLLCDEIAEVEALTHTELFLLGCAFLLHDLGHTPAAYGGLDTLRSSPEWVREKALALRPGHPAAVDEEALELEEIDRATMRELHAKQATAIATNEVEVLGEPLLAPNLASEFGAAIGAIAASHHEDVGSLLGIFGSHLTSPTGFGEAGQYNRLKVAGLLRLVDYSHLDRRRVPLERYVVIEDDLSALSKMHWVFQGKLDRPTFNTKSNLIEFSSGDRSFEPHESDAWWLCYDMLRGFDNELRAVTRLFAANGIEGLRASGVAAIESPLDMCLLIRTNRWEPIEARISAATPLRMIELFAERRPTVIEGLRELILNACDASLAMAALAGTEIPQVMVEYHDDGDQFTVTVTDRGIGMRAAFLTESLLKFGESTWVSRAAERQYPGLAESAFVPSGRFGIGFFGAFTLGDSVTVLSRHMDEAASDARALELSRSRLSYPVVRILSSDESSSLRIGTAVTVTGASLSSTNIMRAPSCVPTRSTFSVHALGEALSIEFIASAVDIEIRDQGSDDSWSIGADQWRSMPDAELLRLLVDEQTESYEPELSATILEYVPLVPLTEGHQMLGRAQISPLRDQNLMSPCGYLFDGGALLQHLDSTAGLIEGRSDSTQRNSGTVAASPEAVASWATECANAWSESDAPGLMKIRVAALSHSMGADVQGVPVAISEDGLLTVDEFEEWVGGQDDLTIVFFDWAKLPNNKLQSRTESRSRADVLAAFESVPTGVAVVSSANSHLLRARTENLDWVLSRTAAAQMGHGAQPCERCGGHHGRPFPSQSGEVPGLGHFEFLKISR